MLMAYTTVKKEPMELIDVSHIKIEPDEDTDNIFEPIIIKDEFDIKIEIKEEIEEMEGDGFEAITDNSMSPSSSIPLSPDSTCKVEIVEQPLKKVRFRYLSELQGTPHGPLLGENSTKLNKTFPIVRLVGYEDPSRVAKIRCWLVDVTDGTDIRPHCHDLVVRKNTYKSEIVSEPHEMIVGRENNYTAVFENMVVLHCVQKDSESKYAEKEWQWRNRHTVNPVYSPKFDKSKMRETVRNINKNEVYLYFEAFIENRNSVEIICQALSNPVKNLKNPISGDLKICRIINNYGPCTGNTEVGLFTEKVPIDVKVKWFKAENPQIEEYITPDFMHRNLALTFKTPSLAEEIEEEVRVELCLFRESDGGESNRMSFTYHPTEQMLGSNKRRRLDQLPALSSNFEITDDIIIMVGNSEENGDWNRIANNDLENLGYNDATKQWSGSSLIEILGMDSDKENELLVDSLEADGVPGESVVRRSHNARELKLKKLSKFLCTTFKKHPNCLHDTVEEGNVDFLRQILEIIKQVADLKCDKDILETIRNLRNGEKETLLHAAVRLNRINMIQDLLKFGCSPFDKDLTGNNAFHMAAHKSNSTVFINLIGDWNLEKQNSEVVTNNSKPDHSLELKNYAGLNCMHLAVLAANAEVVSFICNSKCIDVNAKENKSGDTALHMACRLQNVNLAKILLNNGANVCETNLQGYTALQTSVALNHHQMAACLIQEKADPKQKCLSLSLGQHCDEYDVDCDESSGSNASTAVSYDCGNDSFALAHDLMMVSILNGKFDCLKLLDDEARPTSVERNKPNGDLLTSKQMSQLCAVLSDNDNWKMLVKKLERSDLISMAAGFNYPEKVVLNYILQNKKIIFGEDDHLLKLSDTFAEMRLNQAVTILQQRE